MWPILCIALLQLVRVFLGNSFSSAYNFTDSNPWVRLSQTQNGVSVVMDLTIMKNRQQQLGVVFKQEPVDSKGSLSCSVTVETIVSQSPAYDAGLCAGDILIAVDSKIVTNMTQVAKIIKSVSAASFSIRVRRNVKNYVFSSKVNSTSSTPNNLSTSFNQKTDRLPIPKSDSTDDLDDLQDFEKIEIKKVNIDKEKMLDLLDKKPKSISNLESKFKNSKLLSSSNENVSKLAQTIGNFSLRKRKTSVERVTNNDSLKPNQQQSISTPNTPQHSKHTSLFSKNKPLDKTINEDVIQIPVLLKTELSPDGDLFGIVECYETPVLDLDSLIIFNDNHSFTLRDSDKYLNINVWGRNKLNEDILLGYANIPLVHILNECCNSMLGNYVNRYSFLPPDISAPNR